METTSQSRALFIAEYGVESGWDYTCLDSVSTSYLVGYFHMVVLVGSRGVAFAYSASYGDICMGKPMRNP